MTASKSPLSPSHPLRWTLFIACSVILYALFVLPPERIPAVVVRANDKILHALDFFILTLLALRAFFYSSRPLFYVQSGEKSAGFSLLYGATLEWAQQRVPGRAGSFADWLADLAGILAAYGIFRISRLTRNS